MSSKPDLAEILRNVSKIKLRGGVVGKVSTAVIVVSLSLACIAWPLGNIWISLVAIIGIVAIAFTMLWRLISFADRNPQAALFEGAEFLAHEKLIHGIKDHPVIDVEVTDRVQPAVVLGEDADAEKALLPDSSASTLKLPNQDRE